MPRGDKPTTAALALKDGWIYEDALPANISREQYDWWFRESLVLDGVRMGPPLPATTDNEQTTLEPCPKCGDNLALHKWRDAEVSCGRCGFNAPFHAWQSRAVYTRVSAASTAPVVGDAVIEELERLAKEHLGQRRRNIEQALLLLRAAASPAAPQEDAKLFAPPAEDRLHIAICNAVQTDAHTASDILRQALIDYQPTLLTRTELIRVQQRSGSTKVTAVMVSSAAPTPSLPARDAAREINSRFSTLSTDASVREGQITAIISRYFPAVAETVGEPVADGRYCHHHDDDPAHGAICYDGALYGEGK